MVIRAILADIDGTLTEGGRLDFIDDNVRKAIRDVREEGVFFCLASARPWFEQEPFHHSLIAPDSFMPGEAILYEGSCVRLLGAEQVYQLGGLTRDQIIEIKAFIAREGLLKEMVPQANNDLYETTTGYVTPTFISEGRTDGYLLENNYANVKPILERQFPFVEVVMSADAIDINAKGVTKGPPTIKYAEISGIPLHEMAAIGDSGNDLAMLKAVGDAGGLVVYVGRRLEQEAVARSYAQHFIPAARGPLGTAEALEYIILFYTP